MVALRKHKRLAELRPETRDDKALNATRQATQDVLDQIIADQKGEAEQYERDLENLGGSLSGSTRTFTKSANPSGTPRWG